MGTVRRFVLGVAAVLLAVAPLQGSVRTLDFGQLVARADRVVLARCVELRSEWNDERKLIYSFATYEIVDTLKGDAGPGRITVRALGGTVDNITQWAVGGPRFVRGEQDVLFLKLIPGRDDFRVYGLAEGQLQIRHDPKGRRVVRAGLAAGILGLEGREAPIPAGAKGPQARHPSRRPELFVPVEAVMDLIRQTSGKRQEEAVR